MTADLATTRRSLHAVAELVLAGPQYRAHHEIKLRARPYGFGTVVGPDVQVAGATVVRDDVIVSIDGRSARDIAHAVGLEAYSLDDVYHDGSGVGSEEPLSASDEHAQYIAQCYVAGDAALARLVPDAERVLWPEHFDLAIRVDDVNYGVTPGDAHVPEPYAYVGPDEVGDDPFWNAPFGATLLLGPGPSVDSILEFFAKGRSVRRAEVNAS